MTTLTEKIVNPLYRFRILRSTLKGKDLKDAARQAFLYAIYRFSAFKCNKKAILQDIASGQNLELISEELLEAFVKHRNLMVHRGEIISVAELEWVQDFVGNPEDRRLIEMMIYGGILVSSDHWDQMRHEYNWSITEADKLNIAKEALIDVNLGSKRKLEIAKEFGEPGEEFGLAYFATLLFDRNYDQARALGINSPETVIDVVLKNANNGHFRDALDVAVQFLPNRLDLIEEIQGWIEAIQKKS